MEKFLTSNSALMRLARTIVQNIIAVIVANVDYLVGLRFSGTAKVIIIGVCMAILSPIMSEIGKAIKKEDDPDD